MRKSLRAVITPGKYSRYSHSLLMFYCATAALSIALSQVFLLALILSWVLLRAAFRGELPEHKLPGKLALPLAFWVGTSVVAAVIGVNFARALPEVLKTSLYVLLPFAVVDSLLTVPRPQLIERVRAYLFLFIGGQVVASLHTYLSTLVTYEISPRIPGPVTESGQLVLVLSMLGGLLLFDSLSPRWERVSYTKNQNRLVMYAGSIALAIVLVCWPRILGLSLGSGAHIAVGVLLLTGVLFGGSLFARSLGLRLRDLCRHPFSSVTSRQFLLWTAGAMLTATLILNLKRGPWVGSFVVLALLGFFLSRRLLVGAVLGLAVVVLAFAPARERLLQYRDDFTISGGRKNMWALGAELAARYPLGIGPNNASFMRQLDPSLPPSHRHMHNNLLNVAVESGWLGLSAYLWWMFSAVALGLSAWRSAARESRQCRAVSALALALSTGLLGWQVAGLVEYNFGDGEIRMMSFVMMGLVLALAETVPVSQRSAGRSREPVSSMGSSMGSNTGSLTSTTLSGAA